MTELLDWVRGPAMTDLLDRIIGVAHYLNEYSLSWQLDLVALRATSDVLIAICCLAIRFGVIRAIRRRKDLQKKYLFFTGLFGTLILAFGFTHLFDAATLWQPLHGLHGLVQAVTAFVALATVAVMWPMLPELARFPSTRQLADAKELFRDETVAHGATQRALETLRQELEDRVKERTKELELVRKRFETALRSAQVYVFFQDRELRYTWVYDPRGVDRESTMLGRTDDEVLASPDKHAVTAVKRKVLETGTSEIAEVSYMMPEGRVMFSLHIDPILGSDGAVDSIMCVAIDITRIRSLEREQRRLTEELRTELQRYETALQRSNVTVFTQDRSLRYTSISNPMFGLAIEKIIGRTDDDILPTEAGAAVIALKREALTSGVARDKEVRINDGSKDRWYDFHIEPLRDVASGIVGLTSAAVDVTERKEGEAHLRLLMRELTHRSKNLLAVIQAMARQTARHTGTIEEFLDRFSARLQALARSHDLLVQEGWYGASLSELVRAEVGHYVDGNEPQISIEGPALLLTPEAAQSLGLALHELATNAVKYGALSVPAGRVAITWQQRPEPEGGGIEIIWAESGGPAVVAPKRRGFGTQVIERNLARSLETEVNLKFEKAGARCRIIIPAAHISGTR
ncbi:MAG: HWE histidine kinase domain-containing protein [Candidatus Binatus sp.]|uniref:sensor histidine kinase n=1 Tax=Candidatus Binatus sp. TaxID=2811406 RepID=UPI002723FF84|nr:HWE histidine kinase domain-containing protein [Candidatus Binatus sp.]MDO8432490.1 HWE histidine kinase domain-containing protein [Candidatus Binatus sp.]